MCARVSIQKCFQPMVILTKVFCNYSVIVHPSLVLLNVLLKHFLFLSKKRRVVLQILKDGDISCDNCYIYYISFLQEFVIFLQVKFKFSV